jgi:tRNA-Thr(GGU) m(6)t(6)A37 methyltransferase TsaA
MPEPEIAYRPIGVLRTPFSEAEGAPVQPSGARGEAGTAELAPELAPGLADLEGFSHLILLYHCHLAGECRLVVRPFLDRAEHGVFAVRAPARPNPIGLSVVRLVKVEGATLHLADVDMLDGTPLLDVKPYVPEFDRPAGEVRTGWLEGKGQEARTARADRRFQDNASQKGRQP